MPNDSAKTKVKDDSCRRIVCCVMRKVERIEIRRSRIRAIVGGIVSLSVVVAFVPAISYVVSVVFQSGLISYLSLITTDSSAIFSNFGDWLLSVTMVWPVTGSIIFIGLLLILINALRYMTGYLSSVSVYQERMSRYA